MIESFLKNFTIIICSLYMYTKLLNLKISAISLIIDMAFAASISFFLYYIKLYYPLLTIPAMMISSYIFKTIATKTDLGLSITTTIISFGISYVFLAISAILVAGFFELIDVNQLEKNIKIYALCISLMQLLFIGIPFRLRRLKSGMPFLRSKGGSNIGVFISTSLLCSVIVLSSGKNAGLIYTIPIVMIIILGVIILFWWRRKLEKVYIEKLRTNEIQNMRNSINEKEVEIELLKRSNDFLAKIIHKDNKLIPAMELAVREYLQSALLDDKENMRKGEVLLKRLESISNERSGIITEYQSVNKRLPSTDLLSIDALMSYMFNKARESFIELELIISGSVKYMIENVICESDLNTLLADLVENAIIATKNRENKKIIVSLGIPEGHYTIDIFDSGAPFEIETLSILGIKKITTHADTGGSGIGMITIFEIIKKYNASFMIEEIANNNSLFTKRISVIFDNQNQFYIKTSRYNEIKAISQRDDLLVIKL